MRDMVRMEQIVEARMEHVQIAATLLGPNVDLKKFKSVNDTFNNDIDATASLREYALFYAREQEIVRESIAGAMMKAFERMKKDGTIDAFKKRVAEARARIHANDPQPTRKKRTKTNA